MTNPQCYNAALRNLKAYPSKCTDEEEQQQNEEAVPVSNSFIC